MTGKDWRRPHFRCWVRDEYQIRGTALAQMRANIMRQAGSLDSQVQKPRDGNWMLEFRMSIACIAIVPSLSLVSMAEAVVVANFFAFGYGLDIMRLVLGY